MGGKYSILAKNYDDVGWKYDLFTNNIFEFIFACLKNIKKYEVIEIGVRK